MPRTTQKNYIKFTQGEGYVVTATADCNVHLTNKIRESRSLDFSFSLKREARGFLKYVIQICLRATENEQKLKCKTADQRAYIVNLEVWSFVYQKRNSRYNAEGKQLCQGNGISKTLNMSRKNRSQNSTGISSTIMIRKFFKTYRQIITSSVVCVSYLMHVITVT